MEKREVLQSALTERINELRSVISSVATANIADATKRTKEYNLRRERRVLQLIEALVAQLPDTVDFVSEQNYETFLLLTRPQEDKASSNKFYLRAGENIVQVMERYPNRRNLMRAINEYCDANGLRLDTATMTIVAE